MIVLPIMYVLLRAVMLNTPGLIVNNPIYGGDVLGRTPRKFQKSNPSLPFKDRSSNFSTSSQNICSFCKGTHNLFSCDVFKSKHVNDRIRYVSDKKYVLYVYLLLISPMIVLPIMYVLLRAVMLNTPGFCMFTIILSVYEIVLMLTTLY